VRAWIIARFELLLATWAEVTSYFETRPTSKKAFAFSSWASFRARVSSATSRFFSAFRSRKYDRLTYLDVLQQRLAVMDSTAVSLCMENKLPILVLNLWDEQALIKAIMGEEVGTLVSN